MAVAYQCCRRCILDTNDDPAIRFDENGVCNHCRSFDRLQLQRINPDPEALKKQLDQLVAQIKAGGQGKKYDSVMGVSGGVDSTFLALKAKELGLHPLVVHFDNGWNSELAVKNIENIIHKLGFDLHTHVNNWEEFRDLQLSFFKASVLDIEMLTEQAIMAMLYKLARQHGVKYILLGTNVATEGILPEHWYHFKVDLKNITAIHKQFGKVPLKTYPMLGFWKRWYYDSGAKIRTVSLLDYVSYNKDEAKSRIISELGWRDYGGKHYESIFTRFYQSYYLPQKFGIDKRKAHLSTLICSGQMTREEALREMEKPVIDPQLLADDKAYVLKKLGFTPETFEAVMQLPPKKHTDYPSYLTSNYVYQQRLSRFTRIIKKILGHKTPVNAAGPLRVLHIAAWYPHPDSPHSGIFIKEHVDALNRFCINDVIHVNIRRDGKKFWEEKHTPLSASEEQWSCNTNARHWVTFELLALRLLFRELIRKGKARKYDVINLYIAYPFATGLRTLRFFSGKPFTITEQWTAYNFWLSQDAIRHNLRRVKNMFHKGAHVITVSEALADDIREFAELPGLRYTVVPNVVSPELFQMRSSIPGKPVFFMLNVWHALKKPLVAINAFAVFLKKYPDAILRIGGDGPLMDEMKACIAAHGIGSNVVLLGALSKPAVAAELVAATALLHASRYETFSVICAEALSCGTPVVASKVGALQALIGDEQGILVNDDDPANWANAMESIYTNSTRFSPAKVAAGAAEKFAPETIGRKLYSTFRMIRDKNNN